MRLSGALVAHDHRVNSILQQILDGARAASWPEQFATVLGVLFVWLVMRESLWNFPVGLLQAALFGWVCFTGKLYSDAVLQVIYFVAMIYGWWHWTRGGPDKTVLPVQRLSAPAAVRWVGVTLALWAIWGACMARFTDAALAYWDGFILAGSVASQWLQARKALESWIGWLLVNSIAIGIYWVKGFYWFAVLYFIFWLLSWAGLRAWLQSWRKSHA